MLAVRLRLVVMRDLYLFFDRSREMAFLARGLPVGLPPDKRFGSHRSGWRLVPRAAKREVSEPDSF